MELFILCGLSLFFLIIISLSLVPLFFDHKSNASLPPPNYVLRGAQPPVGRSFNVVVVEAIYDSMYVDFSNIPNAWKVGFDVEYYENINEAQTDHI
ncbi:hypothetical protein OWV82_004347 [Melia azedarach]|uniref:Uncharacterized protein n=1 Tax=Melia azedarach TaxID=155640 RepID=A0ACC1YNX8_MELAZ|nr:hypothetical protein OWV82_004347 [Melia azedarach]